MRPGISDPTAERFHTVVVRADDEEGAGAFDAFFAAAAAGLLLVDDDLRVIRVNERLAAVTGLAVEAHRDRCLGDILPAALAPILREVLRAGAEIDKVPFELHGRSFLGTFFPVFAGDHHITGLGGILIDITEHKRLERELRAAIEMRERVLAVVSHDLRNPLGTIQLAISTLPEPARADPEAARRIEMVERATKLMETLICDLLDMAMIQSGTLALQLADQSAEEIVREAIELESVLAEERGLALIDDTRLAGVRLHCDRARILQVLGNLCGNAIKFCRRGDAITVSGHATAHSVTLSIADTGPGIPAGDIPHLFEPYWSTAHGRQRGTGLGLFISHALVQAHGGRLTVDSKLGAGTTFEVILPKLA